MSDLLLEIGTEELPPLALAKLSDAFCAGIVTGLQAAGIQQDSNGQALQYRRFATPRRLAVLIQALPLSAPDRELEKLGPNIKAAYDADGKPSKAALGFASGCGVDVDSLSTVDTPKGERLAFISREPGQPINKLLPEIVAAALAKLPIPKRMRWGARRDEFVRPVQWLLALHGSDVVEMSVYGVTAGNATRGHRFMGDAADSLTIDSADQYEHLLQQKGFVIADFDQRKEKIRRQLEDCGKSLSGQVVIDESLLDEVCSLVEWPQCLSGRFDDEFLALPSEALISSMRSHQKYFHVLDNENRLLANFVTVANLQSRDPSAVIAGNERVIRPRLADAQFFYNNDRKQTLSKMADRLDAIVFQEKLGSIGQKAARLKSLAAFIAASDARQSESARAHCARAAQLCKADLVSDMVGEFADLQGTMGRYYALSDGEPSEVAVAIEEHYLPRFAGDILPSSASGAWLSMADRLDTITGIFGIGEIPSGSKDPFALRRAALGLLRIVIEQGIDLPLRPAITKSIALHHALSDQASHAELESAVLDYILERLRAWYADQGIGAELVQAVLQTGIDEPLDIERRIKAVSAFTKLDQSSALAAANKRVRNLLAKQQLAADSEVKESLLSEPAEQTLAEQVASHRAMIQPMLADQHYEQALKTLAGLKEPVDAFFDDVMVIADDPAIQNNRLALLQQLEMLFGQIADISQLAQ